MVKRKSKQKKEKLPFWKKLDPEFKHISDHLGKIIDNSNLQQATDFLLNVALAIQGVRVTGKIEGALIGPVALKLARSDSEVSSVAGVAGLGVLGLASVSTDVDKPFFLFGEVKPGYETYWIAPFIYGTRPIT